jgi:DNA (cytosine-5)-methyltransferase 1
MKEFAAVDLFCGAGGMTYGFRRAGIPVKVGVDIDPSCRYPIEQNNPGTRFIEKSVTKLRARDVAGWYPRDAVRVLIGCAPCQPFSKYTVRQGQDERWRLLYDFLRLVRATHPDVVSMENVPQLMIEAHQPFLDFVAGLRSEGYQVWAGVVRCADFGIPQTRKRLVLLAGADHEITMVSPNSKRAPTVRDAIKNLPPLEAGGACNADKLHVAPRLSNQNLKRIRATPEGGCWHDWPKKLRLTCHSRITGRYYGSVYGRMAWDEPAPTITTQCYGYGNGRFGHPEQDRAISLREAALLQTFPPEYIFVPPAARPKFKHVGRLIGNAVPVLLGQAIADSIICAYRPHEAARG